jgi:MoxR-like ATPase
MTMAEPAPLAEIEALQQDLATARASIARRFIGQERVVDLALAALLCGGHALLVGLPGLGKTRLVETLGRVMGLSTSRIQFTPDLMPADILGSEVLETAADGTRAFRFIEGPVFCQLLMADEINRASPRTQSALLQAMQEAEVTVAGTHRPLGRPFHVLATQNPIEQEGTYPLPEAQLDRFLVRLSLGYPSAEEEARVLDLLRQSHPIDQLQPVATAAEILACQQAVREVYVDPKVRDYIVALVRNTRDHLDVALGGSPRASLALYRGAQALAAIRGNEFVLPDDVKKLAQAVLAHRMILKPESRLRRMTAAQVVEDVVKQTSVPTLSKSGA